MAAESTSRRVTVAEIARATGVSIATVSKVLNDRSDVSPATRALVKAKLVEHKYIRTPRTPARPAPRRRSRGALIDIVFNDAGSPWAAEMIRGAESTARRANVALVVSALDHAVVHVEQWLEDVIARGSLGAILVASELSTADHQRAARSHLPIILVDPVGDFESELPAFGAGNWGGGVAAAQHLLDLGHRRIGTITGPMRYLSSQARLAGYRAALDRAELPFDPDLVCSGDFHFDSGVAGARALLDLPRPPTAIFAANDEQALGVYAAVQQHGMRVPDDLSVVGFDDVPMSQWALPALTTVRQPIQQLAELATRALLSASETGEMPQGRTELPTTLVVRDSTAAPRG